MREKEQLTFETIAIKGNTGYASAFEKNGLYKVNINTGECTFLCNFDESIDFMRLHSRAIWIKDKVFFVPGSAKNISVYDTLNKSIMSIPVPVEATKRFAFYDGYMKFIDAIQHGNALWMIPSTYPGVLRLDLYTYEIKIYDSWIPAEGYMFRAKICIEGNTVIIPSGNNNILLKFNLNNQSAQIIRVGSSNKGFACIKKIGADYYLAPRFFGSIAAWNPSLNTVTEYGDYPDDFKPGDYLFSDIYAYGGKVYFAPMDANMGIVLENGKLYEDETEWKKCGEPSGIFKVFETNTHVYYHEYKFLSYRRNFKMSISERNISEADFHICNFREDIEESFSKMITSREVLYDNGAFDIENLLSVIS